MTRVLVCGGRVYKERDFVCDILDYFFSQSPNNFEVISGMARGADTFGADWAIANNVKLHKFPAEWERYGGAAGPIRNQQMLEVGRPDLVLAFPGGKGTKDMVRRAKKVGVRVIVYE